MSYKTILVHVDQSPHSADRIRVAAQIALAENAHLVGTALTGLSPFVFSVSGLDPKVPPLLLSFDLLRQEANRALDAFEAQVRPMGVASFERRLIEDEPGAGLSLQARYCDLVVIGQSDPDEVPQRQRPDFPEYVLLNCARPVLIVPARLKAEQVGKRVTVAWNGGMEETRAIAGALPLLRRAEHVDVVVFNPDSAGDLHGAQPGADIGLHLARHGVKIEVHHQKSAADIGKALLSLAMDAGSDLIVMGAYGHSRFREILLGGATRTVLSWTDIPLLMSH